MTHAAPAQPYSPCTPATTLDPSVDEIGRLVGAGELTPIDALRRLVGAGLLEEVPLPGRGRTAERFRFLAEVSAVDLSLGRLVEGHLDALAILDEAGRTAPAGCRGVWAAERPGGALRADRRSGPSGAGGWVLGGIKPYASGAGELDRVLVTAWAADGPRLFDLDLRHAAVSVVPGTWPAVGMADSLSSAVRFDAVECGDDGAVGEPGHYTARWGFWVGAIGVAACWYGGAAGIHRSLRAWLSVGPASTRPAQLAQLGAVDARCGSLARELAEAAAAIDADPTDRSGRLRGRALAVRHLVYEGCVEVLDRAARTGRTSYLTGERAVARRMADLPVYLSQHHPDEDVEELGRDDALRSDGVESPSGGQP